jgi:hypothetical protein
MIEIRRPHGTNKIDLGKMAQKAVTNVRPGLAHDVCKISAAIVCDRKTLADVKAVFFGRVLPWVAILAIKPALDAASDAIER